MTLTAITEAQTALDAAKEAYLKAHDWTLTCNTPGSYWLWSRNFAAEDLDRAGRWSPDPLGRPARPLPWGRITAETEMAVAMTVMVLGGEGG